MSPRLHDILGGARSRSIDSSRRHTKLLSHGPGRRVSLDNVANSENSYPLRFRSTDLSIRSEDSDRAESPSSVALCQRCQNINIEILSVAEGYHHSSLLAMSQTAQTCKLCQLFLETYGDKWRRWSLDRFQVVLLLRSLSPSRSGSFQDHLTTEIDQQDIKISHSNFGSSTFQGDQFFSGAQMWMQTLDTQPHLGDPGRQGAARRFGRPHPSQASVNIVRERPLKCLTIENDPATGMGVHWLREIGHNTASETSFQVAQGWLKRCLAHQHIKPRYEILQSSVLVVSECPSAGIDHGWTTEQVDPFLPPERLPSIMPTILVDVSCGEEQEDSLRLIMVRSRPLAYTTLSYCWGQSNDTSWLTTKTNLHMRLESFKMDELPATIRDCLVISKKLGIRYIWIDALCILQGDPEAWAMEAANMAGIYRGSILTIAASSSISSDQGCFNINSKARFGHCRDMVHIDSTLSDGRKSRLYLFNSSPPDPYREEVLDGPLSHRAWTYQEQVLSRRTLHYAASQLFWTCEHCVLSEDNFPRSNEDWKYPIFAAQRPIRDKMLIDMWYLGAVTEFSRRGITFQSDKLIAISALAKVAYLNKHVEYVAGLWKDRMIEGLMWRRDGVGSKTKLYRCPSWSWASQDSPVDFRLATGRQPMDLSRNDPQASYDDFFMPKVSDVSVEVDSTNSFGSVHNGLLGLDTVVATALLLAEGLESDSELKLSGTLSFLSDRKSWDVNVYMDDMDDGTNAMQKVLCALIGYTWGNPVILLLHPPDMNAKQHTRIGIAEFRGRQHTFESGIKLRTSPYELLDSMMRRKINII